ncbi:MAG: hypothetical protein A4E32_00214 [Methanomassiliicoccales archaeon PtaU1.Bin124]|nr:MAG: hypothetical protein A4E32_00214 [Methanomassiliicoccales archaeon PtaU1.Bin124]
MAERTPDPWRFQLHMEIARLAGKDTARRVAPCEGPESVSSEEENVAWTIHAMKGMETYLKEEESISVLHNCSHTLPEARIVELRDHFRKNRDIRSLHQLWQRRFLENLEARWGPLPDEWARTVIDEGWGEAGRIDGKRIIAAKVPQDLPGWFHAKTVEEKRHAYCHCSRIKQVFLMNGEKIPAVYCNCGGGFYRSNWERVLGVPVKVTVRSTIMKGDPSCSFIITLPEGVWSKD